MAHLEVQVGAGRMSRRAHVADAGAANDRLALGRRDAREVRVPALEAETVLDDDQVAVAAVVPARERHDAATGGADGRPLGSGNVDAGVSAASDPPKAVGAPPWDGAQKTHRPARNAGRGPVPERPQRRGPGNPVDGEAGGALKAADGAAGVGTEATVEPARPVAADVEKELERRPVPPAPAAAHRAAPEPRAAATPESMPRARAGDAVHDQSLVALEAAQPPAREAPRDAVDRRRVEPEGLQRHLERSDVGAGGTGRRRRSDEREPSDDAQHSRDAGAAHIGSLSAGRVR